MRARGGVPLTSPCAVPHTCSPEVRLKVLARTPFFRMLDQAALAEVDRLFSSRGYAAGEPVYRAGEPASELLVVAVGTVKLSRPTLSGQTVLLDVLAPGDFLGMLTALGEAAYPETAEALTTACLLRIGADDFRTVLGRHPQVALAALDGVSRRLAEARRTIRRLSTGTVEQRVAATLLTLAARVGVRENGRVLLQVPLTRQDLAAMTGTTTESVSRVLSRLRGDEVLETGRRWVAIRDREALAARART
jgi:CRP-like cAMP-binding protein